MGAYDYMRNFMMGASSRFMESAPLSAGYVRLEVKCLPRCFRGPRHLTESYDSDPQHYDLFAQFKKWSFLYKSAKNMPGVKPHATKTIAEDAVPVLEAVLKAEKEGYYWWLLDHWLLPQIEQVGVQSGRPVWKRRFGIWGDGEEADELENNGWWRSEYDKEPQKIDPEKAVLVALERVLQYSEKDWKEMIATYPGRVIFSGKFQNGDIDVGDVLAEKYGGIDMAIEVAENLRYEDEFYYHPDGETRPEEPQLDDFEDEEEYDDAYVEWEADESAWFDECVNVTLPEFMEDVIAAAQRNVTKDYGSYERFIEMEFYDHYNDIRKVFEERLLPHSIDPYNLNATLDLLDYALDVAHRSGKMHQHVGLDDSEFEKLGHLDLKSPQSPEDISLLYVDIKDAS